MSAHTAAHKEAAQPARGEPWVVHPKEVAKSTAAYQTDPEILFGCIIVSGTLDSAAVLQTDIVLTHGGATTETARIAHDAFRGVWQSPTVQEATNVRQGGLHCRCIAAARRTSSLDIPYLATGSGP